MAGFLYFFPGLSQQVHLGHEGRIDLTPLAKYDVDHVFKDRVVCPDETVFHYGEGPDGAGVMLYPRPNQGDLPSCFYAPDRQRWFKFRNYWIGVTKGETPTVDDVTRAETIRGFECDDAHGQSWVVPIIRSPDPERVTLPGYYTYDQTGQFVRRQRQQDIELWAEAGDMIDYMLGSKQLTEAEVAAKILRFVQSNYRVGPAEVYAWNELGVTLLTTTFVASVLAAACDAAKLEEYKKKVGVEVSSATG